MNETQDVKLAIGYIRKSTEEDNRQVESFEGQKREIEKYAQANGYIIVKWYREAYTGTEVKLEGEDYLIMEYGDVLAKMLS